MKGNLTVTNIVENAFCPKFTYYELVLGLKQYEGKQGSVKAGRSYHEHRSTTNRTCLPSNAEGKKLIELSLFSESYMFSGKIDEAVEGPKEITIVERKYSDRAIIGATIKVQLGLLSILAEENLRKKARKAIVIFDRAKRHEIQLNITEEIRNLAFSTLQRTRHVLTTGTCPNARYSKRCITCCYRKVCEVGSLTGKTTRQDYAIREIAAS